MKKSTTGYVGITTNHRLPDKFIAQYWDTSTKFNKVIGAFDTIEEAIKAREEYVSELNKYNGRVLPKNYPLPKGVRVRKLKDTVTYDSDIQILHGKYNNKHVHIRVGTFDTAEEAYIARCRYLDSLK